jgi:hypothetical protein
MSKRSIFIDAGQACLRAHYIHVIRTNDGVTEPTLRAVLLQSGLSDDELHALYQEALALGSLDPDAAILPEPDAPPLPDDLLEPDAEADELYADDLPDPALDELTEVDDDAPEDIEEVEIADEIDESPTPPDEPPPAEQLSMF